MRVIPGHQAAQEPGPSPYPRDEGCGTRHRPGWPIRTPVPERVRYDPKFTRTFEEMEPEDYAEVMRDTIRAIFDGPYVSMGMTAEMPQPSVTYSR